MACKFTKSNTPRWVFFLRFLNCTNVSKTRKASQMMISTAKLLHAVQLSNQFALSLSKLGNHIEWKKFAFLTLTSSNEFLIPRKSWAQNCQPIKCQCFPHIEPSQLICSENQLTGFYVRAKLAFNGLNLA